MHNSRREHPTHHQGMPRPPSLAARPSQVPTGNSQNGHAPASISIFSTNDPHIETSKKRNPRGLEEYVVTLSIWEWFRLKKNVLSAKFSMWGSYLSCKAYAMWCRDVKPMCAKNRSSREHNVTQGTGSIRAEQAPLGSLGATEGSSVASKNCCQHFQALVACSECIWCDPQSPPPPPPGPVQQTS